MANSYNSREWNEFQWEKEIRLDEKRISRYFQELPSCIDLPGEEDYIMKKLMGMPDLVPAPNESFIFDFIDDDEEFFSSSEWRNRPGAELYDMVQAVSWRWNTILAGNSDSSMLGKGLSITCLFGKTISRIVDMVNSDDNMPGLKISLLKRILADINTLIGHFNNIAAERHSLIKPVTAICDQLQSCRERTIDLLQLLRK